MTAIGGVFAKDNALRLKNVVRVRRIQMYDYLLGRRIYKLHIVSEPVSYTHLTLPTILLV